MINSSYLTFRVRAEYAWLKEALVIIMASLCIALCAPIAIPLPFTPVPLTVQTSLMLLFAALLGPRKAFAAVSLFLLQGLIGLPVFAYGKAGLSVLLGPTGGYLMSYLVVAPLTGWFAGKGKEKTPLCLFSSMAIGNLVVLFFGTAWLCQFTGSMGSAFLLGFVPFILGDLLKLIVSARFPQQFVRKFL